MNLWADLVDAAVVGAGRAELPTAASIPAALAELAAPAGSDMPAEARLLRLTAAASRARRAGFVPPLADDRTAPDPAPDDDRPAVSVAARLRLADLLATDQTELVSEWARLLAELGRRPPEALIPAVLYRLRDGNDALRKALLPLLGPRAAWLSTINPEWDWVIAANAGPPDPATWTTADRRTRRELLELVRRRDPAAGRDLVESTWSADPAKDRAAFVTGLATALEPADEALLDRAAADRQADVRRAAIGLLAKLPSSAFSGRAVSRAAAAVQLRKGRLGGQPQLVIRPPAETTAEMRADGLDARPPRGTGHQAWLLRQVVSAAPAAWWDQHTGLPPTVLLARAADTEWADALIAGWAEAAIRDAHAPWIGALLDLPEHPAGAPAGALLRALTAADRDSWLAAHPGSPWFAYAGMAPAPWSPSLSAAARERIAAMVCQDAGPLADARTLLRVAATRLEPPTMTEIDPGTVHKRMASGLAEMMNTLSVRTAMRRELAEEPTP